MFFPLWWKLLGFTLKTAFKYFPEVLTMVIMLYIISPGLIYLITESLWLLTPIIQSPCSLSLASGNYKSNSFDLVVAVFFFFLIPHVRAIYTVVLFLWLFSLGIMPWRFICVVNFLLLFHGWVIFIYSYLCVCVGHVFFIHSSVDGPLSCSLSWLLQIRVQALKAGKQEAASRKERPGVIGRLGCILLKDGARGWDTDSKPGACVVTSPLKRQPVLD